MELMVVVIVVSILAALAIPSMIKAKDDRRAYDSAAQVQLLLRSARMRAISRGAAVAVHFTADGTTDRGRFMAYEAVTATPPMPLTDGGSAAVSTQQYPFSSCTTTTWTNAPAGNANGAVTFASQPFDGLDLNGNLETTMNLQTVIAVGTATTQSKDFWLCFTPIGRVYASNGPLPDFSTGAPFISLDVCVGRYPNGAVAADCNGTTIGPMRHVLVPPSGMARMSSK
jgi:Tfp pilus assembly protein FimT